MNRETSMRGVRLTRLFFDDIGYNTYKYMNLSGVILQNEDLSQIDFSDIPCEESDFSSSLLTNCTFINNNLQQAKFINADLTQTFFNNCNLDGCDFTGCNVSRNTEFNNCTVSKTFFETVNLKKIRMSGIILTGTDFQNIDFTACRLRNTDFSNINFSNSIFDEADLQGCNFIGTNGRTDTIMTNVTISNTNFKSCKLSQSFFTGVGYENYKNTTFDNIDFSQSQLNQVNFDNCTLINCNFRDTDKLRMKRVLTEEPYEFDENIVVQALHSTESFEEAEAWIQINKENTYPIHSNPNFECQISQDKDDITGTYMVTVENTNFAGSNLSLSLLKMIKRDNPLHPRAYKCNVELMNIGPEAFDLSYIDFREAILVDSVFENVLLEHADLRDIKGADTCEFRDCTLSKAKVSESFSSMKIVTSNSNVEPLKSIDITGQSTRFMSNIIKHNNFLLGNILTFIKIRYLQLYQWQ